MSAATPVIRPLLLALAVAGLPHVTTLPIWISLWCAGFWCYAWQAERRSWNRCPGGSGWSWPSWDSSGSC